MMNEKLFIFCGKKINQSSEAVVRRCSVKEVYLEISQTLLKKRLWHRCLFSYEFCEISKNIFFDRTPLLAASESMK